jgi:hypothetical protein
VLAEQGTLAQFSCPGAHAQNRVAERKHRHLLKTARAFMIASSVPPHFWVKSVSTAIYLINIHPSSALQGGIPFECLCGKTPNYSSLHLFDCVCYVLLAPREHIKLIAQSVECVFLGYNAEHKGYRCWDPVARRMRTSQVVVFDESHPFYPRSTTDASSVSLVDPLSLLLFPDAPAASLPIPHSTLPSSVSSFESPPVVPDYTVKPPVTQFYSCVEHACPILQLPRMSSLLMCHLLLSLRMCHLLLLLSPHLRLIPLRSILFDVVTAFVSHLTVTLLWLSQPLLFLSQFFIVMLFFTRNDSTRWLRRLLLLSRLTHGILCPVPYVFIRSLVVGL